MEHLGDAVAGRYVLVAPQPPSQARRQYHAVDMLLDRTVIVRFEPRRTADLPGMARLKTADGQRVLDGGTFEGSHFVVVDGSIDLREGDPLDGEDAVLVAELEAMLAAPCVDEPQARIEPGRRRPRLPAADRLCRLALTVIEFAGGVAIIVLLVAAGFVALGGRADPADAGTDDPAGPPVTVGHTPSPGPRVPAGAPIHPGN